MDGASLNITEDLIQKLKEIIPQVFTEDKLDIQQLQTVLGTYLNTDAERYGLSWAGKSEAYKVLQSPSTATLIPNPEQSIDWDNAENIFIEGENLEVLKVLQKSYYGKVKMIYIDPPYNTGKDSFIYPDKFSETKEEYLKRVGDKDDDGYMMKEGLFRKNNRESGQFHSNWLNMMLPRLFLARNILKEDGVIFLSINDNEQSNLKLLLDEIFGEENFLCQMIWRSGTTASSHFTNEHEYVIAYAKNKEKLPLFSFEGDDIISDRAIKRESQKNPASEIFFPKGIEFEGEDKVFPNEFGNGETVTVVKGIFSVKDGKLENDVVLRAGWTMKDMIESWIDGEDVIDQKGQRVLKFFFKSNGVLQYQKEKGTLHPKSIIEGFTTKSGSKEVLSLFGKAYFDFPKPPKLIYDIAEYITKKDNNDIILDFFAGSGTTAQAVIELNENDKGNRKYICVQLPERIDEKSEAYKAGYKTIAEITHTRIEKVIERIKKKRDGNIEFEKYQNLGFRKYTLASSNFKIWRGDVVENEEDLIKQMQLFTTPQKEGTQSENILWELLIKNGVPLTEKIESSTLQDGAKIYYTTNKKLAFVLDSYTDAVQTAVLELKPKNIICLDSLFHNNDNVKTNAQLKFEDNGISFKTI